MLSEKNGADTRAGGRVAAKLEYVTQATSAKGNTAKRGEAHKPVFANVRRHFWLSQLGAGGCCRIQGAEPRDAGPRGALAFLRKQSPSLDRLH